MPTAQCFAFIYSGPTTLSSTGISTKFVKVYFDWDHAIFGNPVLYNTDRFQKSNDLYWLRFAGLLLMGDGRGSATLPPQDLRGTSVAGSLPRYSRYSLTR